MSLLLSASLQQGRDRFRVACWRGNAHLASGPSVGDIVFLTNLTKKPAQQGISLRATARVSELLVLLHAQ